MKFFLKLRKEKLTTNDDKLVLFLLNSGLQNGEKYD